MEIFAKMITGFQPVSILAKGSISDVRLGIECVSDSSPDMHFLHILLQSSYFLSIFLYMVSLVPSFSPLTFSFQIFGHSFK